MGGNQYVELIRRVLTDNGIALGDDEIERIVRLANKVRVPMREDIMRNFVAAYLRVVLGWSARDADRVASSSRGRRTWEDKIRTTLRIVKRMRCGWEEVFGCEEHCIMEGYNEDEDEEGFNKCMEECLEEVCEDDESG